MLGYLFDLDESHISRELHNRLLPVLLDVVPVPLRDAPLRPLQSELPTALTGESGGEGKPRERIRTLPELLVAYPEIEEALLDATEQSIPQPKDKLTRKRAYSGKQQDHTVKTQHRRNQVPHPARFRQLARLSQR